MVGHKVNSPNVLYRGKSYNDWIKDYFTWYFSDDPDSHNTGPVVFLKSVPSGHPYSSKANTGIIAEGEIPDNMREPNVRVGRDKLDIYLDQAILIPAIVAYFSATGPSDTIHTLQNFVRDAAANSDNPPRKEQILIDGDPIDVLNMRHYSFETDLFTLTVPDVPPGRSYATYVEYPPLMTGNWPTIGSGYFFLVTFDEPGTHIVQSRAKGKKYLDGRDYYADLFYEIVVHDTPILPKPTFDFNTERRTAIMLKKIKDKKEELSAEDLGRLEILLYKPETLTRLKTFGVSLGDYDKLISSAIKPIPQGANFTFDLFDKINDKLSRGEITSQVSDEMKRVIKFDLLSKLASEVKEKKLDEAQYKILKDNIEKKSKI
jgi:hypothetical protein